MLIAAQDAWVRVDHVEVEGCLRLSAMCSATVISCDDRLRSARRHRHAPGARRTARVMAHPPVAVQPLSVERPSEIAARTSASRE